jgi:long-chain acyl-CoA synthetase
VYPEDIENAFAALSDVEEYCVFAANYVWPSGSLTDDLLVLALRPKPGVEPDERFLSSVRSLNATLSEYKRVHGVVVCSEEFPRTASQKIKREELARLLGARARDEAIVSL